MEENDEEILLYLEFNGMLHEDVLKDPNATFKAIGFDTDKPVIQIGEEIYEGEYGETKGTNVIFEEDLYATQEDDVFEKDVKKRVKYVSSINKILKMNRIFISKKNMKKDTDNSIELKISNSYPEALRNLIESLKVDPSDEATESPKADGIDENTQSK